MIAFQFEVIPGVLTIDLLDAPPVVFRQLEVFRLHPLVKGSHDGQRVVGVFQAKSVAQLVNGHQEEVVAWRRRGLMELVERTSRSSVNTHLHIMGTLTLVRLGLARLALAQFAYGTVVFTLTRLP